MISFFCASVSASVVHRVVGRIPLIHMQMCSEPGLAWERLSKRGVLTVLMILYVVTGKETEAGMAAKKGWKSTEVTPVI